jgi:hypothetical protein
MVLMWILSAFDNNNNTTIKNDILKPEMWDDLHVIFLIVNSVVIVLIFYLKYFNNCALKWHWHGINMTDLYRNLTLRFIHIEIWSISLYFILLVTCDGLLALIITTYWTWLHKFPIYTWSLCQLRIWFGYDAVLLFF